MSNRTTVNNIDIRVYAVPYNAKYRPKLSIGIHGAKVNDIYLAGGYEDKEECINAGRQALTKAYTDFMGFDLGQKCVDFKA